MSLGTAAIVVMKREKVVKTLRLPVWIWCLIERLLHRAGYPMDTLKNLPFSFELVNQNFPK